MLRHPHYNQRYLDRKDPLCLLDKDRNTPANYRTFELADPRDSNLLPCLVGYTNTFVSPVWSRFLVVAHSSQSRWAKWLLDLTALGLEPMERPLSSLGVAVPIGANSPTRLCGTVCSRSIYASPVIRRKRRVKSSQH